MSILEFLNKGRSMTSYLDINHEPEDVLIAPPEKSFGTLNDGCDSRIHIIEPNLYVTLCGLSLYNRPIYFSLMHESEVCSECLAAGKG